MTNAEILQLIEEAIKGTLSRNMAEYEIQGRKVKSYSITELLKLRDHYKALVDAETYGTRVYVAWGRR